MSHIRIYRVVEVVHRWTCAFIDKNVSGVGKSILSTSIPCFIRIEVSFEKMIKSTENFIASRPPHICNMGGWCGDRDLIKIREHDRAICQMIQNPLIRKEIYCSLFDPSWCAFTPYFRPLPAIGLVTRPHPLSPDCHTLMTKQWWMPFWGAVLVFHWGELAAAWTWMWRGWGACWIGPQLPRACARRIAPRARVTRGKWTIRITMMHSGYSFVARPGIREIKALSSFPHATFYILRGWLKKRSCEVYQSQSLRLNLVWISDF